ncbi:MAG: hypothetical protein HON98_13145 [Chloroflexi bacterium]|jgi:hypothetical protein|nr:hypothetical protein [Chloroflexota bacterium]MBT4002573.1 hypothetical protein [Chloroflexota bacterium]MBT4305903.1 hypothetical protein [Chloroflexota bacterium]MBT4533728.1 hypothetical protein [Chloroflexota bacterium]MBT4681629.1 hypothetical protein [Chloroflexota bacterium]
MESPQTDKINEAVRLIKGHNLDSARKVLTEILNSNANSDKAWYLLSFTLPSKERQIYALNQSIKINPSNKKAIGLLSELEGKKSNREIDKKPIKPIKKNEESQKTIKSVISKPTQNVDNENLNKEINQLRDISKYDESFQNEVEISSSLGATESESLEQNSGDLLSARLPIENGEIDKKEENQKIVYDGDDGISEIRNEAIHFSDDRETDIDIKKSKRRVRKLNKKLPINKLRSNRRLVLIILILIFGSGAYYLYSNGLLNTDTGDQIIALATDLFLPTETPTITKTSIPSTKTIVPSITPTKTTVPISMPANTPIPIATMTAEPMLLAVQDKIIEIQEQVGTISGLNNLSEVNTYLVSNQYIENVLNGEFNSVEFIETSQIESDLLEYIGINSNNYDLSVHIKNKWVEPRGGLYIPTTKSIFFSGLNFEAVEQYIYVQEYSQHLIDHNYGIPFIGAYPHCLDLGQDCQSMQALIKGEAILMANLWAENYLSIEERASLDNLFPQIYFLPAGLPPAFSSLDLEFNTIYGEEFVSALYEFGGFPAVHQAYNEPPVTTEQIMHPEKYFDKESPLDVEINSYDGLIDDNWKITKKSELGEWGTYLLLGHGNDPNGQLGEAKAFLAAAGWGGDQVQYLKNKITGGEMAAVYWVMDSVQDGNELFDAVTDYLEKSGGEYSLLENGIQCWKTIKYSCLYGDGEDVVLVFSSSLGDSISIINGQIGE